MTRDVTADVEAYTIESVQRSPNKYQGRQATRVAVHPTRGPRTIPQGSVVALADQPLGVLLTYLLEPQSADGFVTWDLWEPKLVAETEYPAWRIPTPLDLPLE